MTKLSLIFFGSFSSFSVQILDALLATNDYRLIAVITTPPSPKGRHLTLTKNETQIYAEKHNIPLLSLDDLPLFKPDFLVVAGFGKLIPQNWLDLPKIMAINMHPSLLPNYPGRCPAEWAILNGETQTGVTLIKMTEKFDAGPILTQEKITISPNDTRLTLYKKLYDLGAKMLIDTLPKIAAGKIQTKDQRPMTNDDFYARQIVRQDGFIPYDDFYSQLKTNDQRLMTKFRAFYNWPGTWTTNPSGKRLKLISLDPILVQYEGKKPTVFKP